MNEFRDISTSDAASDPLERLIEAFVGQSAPEGPDAATQRRLIAALRAADGPVGAGDFRPQRTADARPERGTSHSHRWFAIAAQQILGLAAAILVVIGAALAFRTPNEVIAELPNPPSVATIAESASDVESPEADTRLTRELAALVDNYLRTHRGEAPDRETAKEMLATLLRDHPELASSDAWRFAHDRLTYALERPKVITLGVGLLGTFPWTTFGRF